MRSVSKDRVDGFYKRPERCAWQINGRVSDGQSIPKEGLITISVDGPGRGREKIYIGIRESTCKGNSLKKEA